MKNFKEFTNESIQKMLARQEKEKAKIIRKAKRLVSSAPAEIKNHKPSLLAWLRGELRLTAKNSIELSFADEIELTDL